MLGCVVLCCILAFLYSCILAFLSITTFSLLLLPVLFKLHSQTPTTSHQYFDMERTSSLCKVCMMDDIFQFQAMYFTRIVSFLFLPFFSFLSFLFFLSFFLSFLSFFSFFLPSFPPSLSFFPSFPYILLSLPTFLPFLLPFFPFVPA